MSLPHEIATTASTTTIDGVALHCREAGRGDVVLLISGWPQSARCWADVMGRLAPDHRVIAVEPPALGASSPAPRYDMSSIAALFAGLIDRLDLAPLHLVGHDVGCWIAFTLAATRPELLRSVTLMEAAVPGLAPPGAGFTLDQAAKAWHFFFNVLPELPEALVQGREHILLDWIFRHRAARADAIDPVAIAEYVRLYSRPGAYAESLNYYRALAETAAQNRALAARPLTLPVLGVGGALWLGDAMRTALAPLATDLQMRILPDCAHFPPEEKPDEVAAALREFFARSKR